MHPHTWADAHGFARKVSITNILGIAFTIYATSHKMK
uniref:Uncharacterized protein n=1 Tax=Rhizophora mucronata TaxID=61149 RepID=A0A2P2Q238_RHIMU